MATTDLHVVSAPATPTAAAAVAAPAHRRWIAPAAAAGIGALAGVGAAWLVVAAQGFEITLRTMGL